MRAHLPPAPTTVRRVAERAALVLLSLPDDLHGMARLRGVFFFPRDCVYDVAAIDEVVPDDVAFRRALEEKHPVALRSALALLAAIDPAVAGPFVHDMIVAEASPDLLSAQTSAKGLLRSIVTLPLATVQKLAQRADLDGDAIEFAYRRQR